MNAVDVVRYAVGALRGARLRAGLVVLAMAIGVAGVVLLTWLGDAARLYVTGEFSSLGTNLVIVLPGRSETTGGMPPVMGETPRDLTIDDALAVARSPGVKAVAPVVVGNAPVSRGRYNRETTIIGSTPELFAVRNLHLSRGKLWLRGDPRRPVPVCVLGKTIQGELFGSEPPLGQWVRIGDRRFRVIGIIASAGRSLGLDLDEMAVIPVASAQMLFDTPALFRLLLEARSRDHLGRAERDAVRILKERHEGEEDVTVITQDAVLATFDRILRALTMTVGGIASISLLVAGILVMNVMVVAVSQRREEIGLLKALGAPPSQILALFLVEAILLSSIGAGLGVLVGTAGTWIAAGYVAGLAPGPPAWAVIAALAVSVGMGLVFGVSPARRAARLTPMEALSRR